MGKLLRSRRIVVLAVVAAAMALYTTWCCTGRGYDRKPPELFLRHVSALGTDIGRGNIVVVQPYMTATDYSSSQSFSLKLEGYLRRAHDLGWFGEKTVVVLPEFLGAWLVVAGEKRGVYESSTLEGMMVLFIASNPIAVARAAATTPARDKATYAVFRTKAESMAGIYDSVLSSLARTYRVTIVGGSTVLPSPVVSGGRLAPGDGPLYSVTPVYMPDGSLYPNLVVKVFLTEHENGFVSPGHVGDLPVFDTPAGRLGVLICADSWFPASYDLMKSKKASIVVVPSYIDGDRSLAEKWKGYSGQPKPADVPASDIQSLTNRQAWTKHALAGRLPGSGIPAGAMSCLRGKLWDVGSDGSAVVVLEGKAAVAPVVDGAALVNMWLARP